MTKWADLKRLHDVNKGRHILDLFDESRAADYSVRADGMLFDYSKTNLDAATRAALVRLAEVSGVAEKRAAMFSGAKINDTEGRAVLHVALRAGDDESIFVDGKDVLPEVRRIRAACAAFARDVRQGGFKGQGGRITDDLIHGLRRQLLLRGFWKNLRPVASPAKIADSGFCLIGIVKQAEGPQVCWLKLS